MLRDLTSHAQGGAIVVGVTGTYPIIDYTYYDYDPETFVVDMADVDVSQLPKIPPGERRRRRLRSRWSPSARAEGRALAKLEIHKAYLAKCLVSTEGNQLCGEGRGRRRSARRQPRIRPAPAGAPGQAEPPQPTPDDGLGSVAPRRASPQAKKLLGV